MISLWNRGESEGSGPSVSCALGTKTRSFPLLWEQKPGGQSLPPALGTRTRGIYIYIYIYYQIYVKNGIYRPHLAKTINLRQFRMEIDRKNGSILTIILPGRFEKYINSKNNVIFSEPFFLKNVFPQLHFTSSLQRPLPRPLQEVKCI